MAYGAAPYQAPSGSVASPTHPPAGLTPQQFQNQHHQHQLHAFWASQMQEVEQVIDFKNHGLPLARIKKIMKADEDVRMISAEAPVVFAKACEMFILELTLRSWIHTEENKRRTLQKNDIAAAISRTDVFDFLVDIIPRDELKEEGLGLGGKGTIPLVGSPHDSMPCYYVPSRAPVGVQASLITPGKQVDQVYAGQHQHLPFMPWPQHGPGGGGSASHPQPPVAAPPWSNHHHQNDS